MKVLGVMVTPAIESACMARMRAGWFTASYLAAIASIAGRLEDHVPIAYRVADRLIQRERKAGHLIRQGKGWLWND